jgi:hypothetical protein
MKNVLFCSLIVLASSLFAQDLAIKQELKVRYYAKTIVGLHMNAFTEKVNEELRKFNCLQPDIETTITKEARTRIFSKDEPGEVLITVRSTCYNSKLKGFRFSIDSFGYDEDYTDFNLELATQSGIQGLRFCGYGLYDSAFQCPLPPDGEQKFSSEIEE